jgi:hypothetical protein
MNNEFTPPSEEHSSEPKPETSYQPGQEGQPEQNVQADQDSPQPGQAPKPLAAPEPKPNPLNIHEARNTKSFKKWGIVAIVVLIAILGAAYFISHGSSTPKTTSTPPPAPAPVASKAAGLQLDANKNYGNKYANGILPVGDNKYVTDAAKQGSVYVCNQYAQNLKNEQGGAGKPGPWFVNNTQYDLNKKLHVQGSVAWQGSFSNKVSNAQRIITSNDLPNHPTGTFPISSKDPAYAYDKNPNSIKAQSLTYALANSPAYGAPKCVGGEVGIMLTGVALFNGFDAGGRDAGAWEVQDSCSGHPQVSGEYHYHTLSSCIKDTSVNTVIGYALDGFPITGPQVATGNILTSSDLDVCHGISSEVVVDGKTVTTYHYVMTQDFPYSVSCFRSAAIQPPDQQAQPQTQPSAQPPTKPLNVPPTR